MADARADGHALFRAICRDYFPRWRAGRHWRLVEGPHGSWVDAQGQTRTTAEQGYCDRTTNTIYLNRDWSNTYDPRLVLIHETCHAVTSGAHNRRFCARLRHAAERATALGDTALSTQLTDEADAYARVLAAPRRPGTSSIASRITDILCDTPEATFDQVVLFLAEDSAATPAELIEQYPRLRTRYDQIRQEELRTLRHQLTAARCAGIPAHRLRYTEERLRIMEAVSTQTAPVG
jgi:hypothetical protein